MSKFIVPSKQVSKLVQKIYKQKNETILYQCHALFSMTRRNARKNSGPWGYKKRSIQLSAKSTQLSPNWIHVSSKSITLSFNSIQLSPNSIQLKHILLLSTTQVTGIQSAFSYSYHMTRQCGLHNLLFVMSGGRSQAVYTSGTARSTKQLRRNQL